MGAYHINVSPAFLRISPSLLGARRSNRFCQQRLTAVSTRRTRACLELLGITNFVDATVHMPDSSDWCPGAVTWIPEDDALCVVGCFLQLSVCYVNFALCELPSWYNKV